MTERTLSIVKPDAVRKNKIGEILARLEGAGFKIVAGRYMKLSKELAARFYEVHKERPFYGSLCEYMSSGPIFVSVLEGPDAIATNRRVMGATDPAKADANSIRRDFGSNVEQNACHGSDGPDTARAEIAFFFRQLDVIED